MNASPHIASGREGSPLPAAANRAAPSQSDCGAEGTPRPTFAPANAPVFHFVRTSGFPTRRPLPHGPPPFASPSSPVQFVTICAVDRASAPFLPVAETLLSAARFYHERGDWFLHLFLVMPDHVHALVRLPTASSLRAVVSRWKHYVSRTTGAAFQRDFFEHRIRHETEYAEKWAYILENPVRKGVVQSPDDWPHVFVPAAATGRAGSPCPPPLAIGPCAAARRGLRALPAAAATHADPSPSDCAAQGTPRPTVARPTSSPDTRP